MARLTDYLRLCRRSPVLGAVALFAVVVARLAVWAVPFRRLEQFSAGSIAGHAAEVTPNVGRRSRIASAIRTASRLIPGASCLTQALAAQALLRLRGDWAKLCLGAVRGDRGEFKAHAWLEANGVVIIGDSPELSQFRKFGLGATVP